MPESQDTWKPLDWHSWLSLVVFFLVIGLVIHPVSFRIPFLNRARPRRITLGLGAAPILGILFLWATTCIGWQQIVDGFLGREGIQPYSIVILLFALAYICVSLDLSGIFAFLALWVTKRSGTSGRWLFFYFYLLALVLAALTSNDVVILTFTPILVYFGRSVEVDPKPFLMAEFIAANTASMALYIGNPTNIVVAQAYGISFFQYSAWMILPFLGASVVSFVLLQIVFRKHIPATLRAPEVSPKTALIHPKAAIIGIVILFACLITLIVTSFWEVPVWEVTLPFACLMLIRDVIADTHSYCKSVTSNVPNSSRSKRSSKPRSCHILARFSPTLESALSRMPWAIAPFALGMFILVEALDFRGWTGRFAVAMMHVTPSLVPAIFAVGFISTLACNLLNNLPMAILFVRILQDPHFVVDESTRRGCLFALIVGSNLGANLTILGSLAGLMWSDILRRKNVVITYFSFLKWNIAILPFVLAVTCGILAAEFVIVG
ncbi:hypothetical protein K493DRAFT_223454 [Basidiobolus meristosporus CBS 931.73]|uniref:Citrate transporter-like domain-containing protein n=1 Tax=Basidiobolus meristosporus CBS 931.73 TaxID=1314790 RepID=A0A1Y1Y5U0_9FUNG|nr:hypothetical protein K493DRAFT_223454 [Basidiobolus meristosporus CBS 931.73]|eukprot:ORX93348.1 hypothetical protein K493DRAFT_223454 [Basidiobolus meristosporus CBS 931.73]